MTYTKPTLTEIKTIRITSDAFVDGEHIPVQYTCHGLNVSPPLRITNVPEGTVCLALIVDDPDAPIRPWTHWVTWNIPVAKHILQGSSPGKQGQNDFRERKYSGPCPPSNTHHYFFRVYALDAELDLPPTTDKYGLEKAMQAHIIGYGELVGLFKSPKK